MPVFAIDVVNNWFGCFWIVQSYAPQSNSLAARTAELEYPSVEKYPAQPLVGSEPALNGAPRVDEAAAESQPNSEAEASQAPLEESATTEESATAEEATTAEESATVEESTTGEESATAEESTTVGEGPVEESDAAEPEPEPATDADTLDVEGDESGEVEDTEVSEENLIDTASEASETPTDSEKEPLQVEAEPEPVEPMQSRPEVCYQVPCHRNNESINSDIHSTGFDGCCLSGSCFPVPTQVQEHRNVLHWSIGWPKSLGKALWLAPLNLNSVSICGKG